MRPPNRTISRNGLGSRDRSARRRSRREVGTRSAQRYLPGEPLPSQAWAVVYQSALHVVNVTERVQIPSANPVFRPGQ